MIIFYDMSSVIFFLSSSAIISRHIGTSSTLMKYLVHTTFWQEFLERSLVILFHTFLFLVFFFFCNKIKKIQKYYWGKLLKNIQNYRLMFLLNCITYQNCFDYSRNEVNCDAKFFFVNRKGKLLIRRKDIYMFFICSRLIADLDQVI